LQVRVRVRVQARTELAAAVELKEQSWALWLEIVSTIVTRHSLYYEVHQRPARPETVEARCPVWEA